jgi:hypothetical protein
MSPHHFIATNNWGYPVLERTIYSITQDKEKKLFWEELIQFPCSVIKYGWGNLHTEFYKLIIVQLAVINPLKANSPVAKLSGRRLGASARGNNSWNSENIFSFSLAVVNC